MKRFWRWLFNVLAGLLLALCVVTIAIWVTGWEPYSQVALSDRWVWYGAIESRPAEMSVAFCHFFPTPIIGSQSGSALTAPASHVNSGGWRFNRWGIAVGHQPALSRNRAGNVILLGYSWWGSVPDWVIIVALATLAVVALKLGRRLKREIEPGICTVCGYDLRASPERCPECGTIPSKDEIISN
jgi:hypothetical protein